MKNAIIAGFLVILAACTASAEIKTLVRWGSATDIVSATASLTGQSSTDSLNLTSYGSPAQGSSYYPNYVTEGASPNFYAATTGDRFQILDNAAGDYIYSRSPVNGYIVLWTQDLFLNGGNSGSVTLAGMGVKTGDNTAAITTTARFVIRLGSNYYISQTFAEGAQSFSDASRLTWYNYDISSYSTIGSEAAVTDFSNLTAAGVYIDDDAASSQSKLFDFYMEGITVAPAPATIGMLGLGFLITLLIRRTR